MAGTLAFASSFYDGSTFDKKRAYEFLEGVENEVGQEAFEGIRYDNAMHLAMRLGPIDRSRLTPEIFVRHIRHVEAVERRFYQKRPLTADELKAHLLPLRIRFEHTSRPDWRVTLAKEFDPIVKNSATTKEAAALICRWIQENLALDGSATAYRMPMRGDLDPLTVLRGKRGSEIDLTIFGVAALRTVGVAARLVWAPVLRGEVGGKCWLEYLNEEHEWIPWVPTIQAQADHRDELRKSLGPKIVAILANPEVPVEITGEYVNTVEIRMGAESGGVPMTLLVLGKEGLVPAYGLEESRFDSSKTFRIGRGPVFLAVSMGKLDYSVLPLAPKIDQPVLEIQMTNGKPGIFTGRSINPAE